MSISIIIPVYNEEESIKECLRQTTEIFQNIDFELIVVNDGSTDNSHQIISRLIADNPKTNPPLFKKKWNGKTPTFLEKWGVKYISYSQNKGYSYAIKQGFKEATKEYVSFIDADLQYHPKELLKMYNYTRKNNLRFVLGIPKTRTKYYNPIRKILSFLYNSYVSFLFGIKLKDANSLKLMSRKYLEKINFQFDYGMIEIETLLGFKMQGIPINTYPINVRERIGGKSKCSLKIIYRTLIDSTKLKFLKNNLIKKK